MDATSHANWSAQLCELHRDMVTLSEQMQNKKLSNAAQLVHRKRYLIVLEQWKKVNDIMLGYMDRETVRVKKHIRQLQDLEDGPVLTNI